MGWNLSTLLLLAASCSAGRAAGHPPAPIDCPPGTALAGAAPPAGAEVFCARPDGVRHGPAVAFYRDGRPLSSGQYQAGEPEGAWTWWRESGTRRADGTYRGGRLEGAYHLYHDDGKLYLESHYAGGHLEGEASRYHATGRRAAHGFLTEGRKQGHWTFFYPSGARQREGFYREGKRVGRWSYWDEQGNPVAPPPAPEREE
jgi:antitoxin component YwqK of YwqJK toxin-antitoxin module